MLGEEDWLRPQTKNLTDQCVPSLYTENLEKNPGGIAARNLQRISTIGDNIIKAIAKDAIVTFPTNVKRAAEVTATAVANSLDSVVGWVGNVLWGCLYALLALLACITVLLVIWRLGWLLIKRKCTAGRKYNVLTQAT